MSQSLGFGIVRATEWGNATPGLTNGLLEELCGHASEASGLRFAPVFAASYDELSAAIIDGDVALAWLPPVPTIELEARGAATVLAIPARRGSTTYHAALVVKTGGPTTLAELRGKRAAWVQRDSAAGYLVPRMHLAAQGFDVLRFFSRELFVHSHSGVVDAVASGEADVGATFCTVDPTGERVIASAWQDDLGNPTRPIEALVTMGPIPNDAMVASNRVPEVNRAALATWLLGQAPRTVPLFERLLGSGDFRAPAANHYDVLRHVLRTAQGRSSGALGKDSRMRMRVGR